MKKIAGEFWRFKNYLLILVICSTVVAVTQFAIIAIANLIGLPSSDGITG